MRTALLLSLAASLACGGGGDPPPTGNNTDLTKVSTISVTGPGTIASGATANLLATARNSAGTAINATFTWSSSNDAIATVSNAGVVTGVGEGSATITASADGVSGTRTVQVQPPIAAVVVSGVESLGIGRSQQFTAQARSAGGTQLPATFTWKTSAPSIATVTNSGVVTAVGAGEVTISAMANGTSIEGSAALTVEVVTLDAIVEQVRQANNMPAMVGAIVTRDAGVIAMGVSGNRRIGGPAATINDKWHIGSNLKGITGALAAIAVKKGSISWNTTIESMFPELGAAIRPEYRTVTLRELLSMQGGLQGNPENGEGYIGTTAREQRESAAAWVLASSPQNARGVYYYSNLSYVVAGAMIERALGGTYEDLVRSELGTPVGATQIGFGPTTAAGGNDQPVAHSWNGSAWVACEACDNPPGLSAAGRAHMSITDWAKITQELMKADAGQSTLLDQANARIMFSNILDGYGLGWNMTTRPWGGRTANHEGSNNLNHSVAWLGLDNGVAFLAATNGARSQSPTSSAALDALVARLLTYYQTGQ